PEPENADHADQGAGAVRADDAGPTEHLGLGTDARRGPGEGPTGAHRWLFGATSRVACQSLLTAAVVVWLSPAMGAAAAMSAASTEPGRPTLGVSSQITPPPTRSVRASTSPSSTRSPSPARHHSSTASTTLP